MSAPGLAAWGQTVRKPAHLFAACNTELAPAIEQACLVAVIAVEGEVAFGLARSMQSMAGKKSKRMTAMKKRTLIGFVSMALAALCAPACGGAATGEYEDGDYGSSWQALMADGDAESITGPMPAPVSTSAPRYCADCSGEPLAFWRLDDCNALSTQLADSAFTSVVSHPAFRSVSASCTEGASAQGVALRRREDVVYAPDQPDFVFDEGLTIAVFIKPDDVRGTQSIVRKREGGTSAFLLAIHDRELRFVVQLEHGRMASISAPIRPDRYTHVAATYDGRRLRLYLDGELAAQARAAGTLAHGAGPIFVGNDASGRRFKGVVDEIWLNTLAAPPDVIAGLTCIRRPPTVEVSPAETSALVAGTSVDFGVSVTNRNDPACLAYEAFDVFASLPFELTSNTFGTTVFAAPGETAEATLDVRSLKSAPVGSFPFQVYAFDRTGTSAGVGEATYVVGTGPISCDGSPPFTEQITGSFASPALNFAYSFSSPDVPPPVVTASSAQGFVESLQVEANASGAPDPSSVFMGFGLPFGSPGCVDASSFSGVRFTVEGDLGTCSLSFEAVMSQNNRVEYGPFGVCTAAECFSASSPPFGLGTTFVPFSDLNGGAPVSLFDPSALNTVQWTLRSSADPAAAPCAANITVRDVAFVAETTPPRVDYRFDSDTQGWVLNQYDDPNNIAVHVPAGVAPPTLVFTPDSGDPTPGALSVSAQFTSEGQYVDATHDFEPLDLRGRVIRARVRLVSGSLVPGGLQLHASSLPGYVFASTAFIDAAELTPGVWFPLTLDLAGVTEPAFNPTQIVQFGVQFVAFGPSEGPVVLEIDTVEE